MMHADGSASALPALPRHQVVAAHVRRLDDTALTDVLVELPPRRFAALRDAAFAELEGVA